MKRLSLLPLALFSGAYLHASTLSVYQDKALYSYIPKSSFIGVSTGITAKCDGETVTTHAIATCPGGKRLCKDLNLLKKSANTLQALQFNDQILDKMIMLPQPIEIDAGEWIKAAKQIGKEKASLFQEIKEEKETLTVLQQILSRQTHSQKAMVSDAICSSDMTLTLPRNYITFSSMYEADLSDKKTLTVTQHLSLTNRSGVDIEAESAMFYYRSANQYVRPLHFNPWIVRKYDPELRINKMKRASVASMNDAPMMEVTAMNASVPKQIRATQVDTREYKIADLELPSSGVPVDVPVSQWTVPMSCGLKTYPYMNTRAFEVCSFTPKFQIEKNQWKLMSDKVIVNEKAQGQYYDGKYDLYTKVDQDIQILRKRIVKNERETGIFGTTVRKKDGFVLTLTNKSDTKKSMTVVDRIPTSTNDEIEVKLLALKSSKKVKYTIDKEGKIEMNITLDPKENRKIEVVFEIAYDKALKVRY